MQTEYNMVILQYEPTRRHKRDWLRMINKFRSEYFGDQNWRPITQEQVNREISSEEKKIWNYMLYQGRQCVAIAEVTTGWIAGQRLLSIATLYVKSTHRSQGLAMAMYDEVEQMAQHVNAWFTIQVEQTALEHNRDKFMEMGFVTYDPIEKFSNGRGYREQTYLLFKGYHLLRLRPLGNYEPCAIKQEA